MKKGQGGDKKGRPLKESADKGKKGGNRRRQPAKHEYLGKSDGSTPGEIKKGSEGRKGQERGLG